MYLSTLLEGFAAKFFNSSAASSSSQPMASATSLNTSLLHSCMPLASLVARETTSGYSRRSSSGELMSIWRALSISHVARWS